MDGEHQSGVAGGIGCALRLGPSGYFCEAHATASWEIARALGAAAPDCDQRDLVALTVVSARRCDNPDRLVDFAKVSEPRVLAAVAANRHASHALLADLATRGEVEVRERVAAHPRTPQDVLDDLALAEEVAVRLAVAGNASASREALVMLSEDDEDLAVRREAERTLRRLATPAARRSRRWRHVVEGWEAPRRRGPRQACQG